MGINIADNFAYNGKKPMDNRTEYTTLSAMKSVADANINEGCLAYNKEDGKYYKFLSTNTVDATTGKWREFETGGGGQTYNDFTGATASTAGAHGLVPAPSAGDEGKVLFGNGAWGALPSVDLSVLSNEAFQFSPTEKPVGMWTDANGVTKLLYQKIVRNITIPSSTGVHNVYTETGAEFFRVVELFSDASTKMQLNYIPLRSMTYGITFFTEDNVLKIVTEADRSGFNPFMAIVQYTKANDSALPSDVKFAGVLSDGTVVYKKTVSTGGSVPSGGTLLYRLPLLNGTDVVYYTT